MIVTLTGKNIYSLSQRLAEITDDFIKDHGDLAVERLDGLEVEPQTVLEAVQSLPFLAEKKLVIVRGLSQNKAVAEQIEQIISSISEDVDVIFYEPSIDRRGSYFKVLKGRTQFEDFSELDANGLAKWLVEQAKKGGGELSFGDANYMVSRTGANRQLLASELDKLLTYNPKISRQTIDLLCEPTPQSRIFDLLEAAFSDNKDRALKLYADQRAQKVEPQAILAMIAWQLRLLALAKHMGNRSPRDVAKEAGVSEFPLQKASQIASKFDETKLKKMVADALDIDVRSKTSNLDLDEALKTYIVSL